MNKGGYQIIDLKGATLTSGTEKTIAGTYAAIANAHGKRTVVSGMKVGTTLYNDFEAIFTAGSEVFNAALTIGEAAVSIAIDSGDGVTVTVTTE